MAERNIRATDHGRAPSTAPRGSERPVLVSARPCTRTTGAVIAGVREIEAEVLVVGGGLGGVAAALAAARNGRRVLLTEETTWLGGQLTSQAVPPDEHPWIESFGCTESYRQLREAVRDHYRRWYPLRPAARRWRALNPGAGRVSQLCAEPTAGVAAIEGMVAPHRAAGRLDVRYRVRPVAADTDGDRVTSVTLEHLDTGERFTALAPYVVDATETGLLLPLTGTEHVTGFESQADTGEPSAPADAQPQNMQAVSWCFVLDHRAGEDHTIDRPEDYEHWRRLQPDFWPGPMLGLTGLDPETLEPQHHTFVPNPDDDPLALDPTVPQPPASRDLWTFRRIVSRKLFADGAIDSDVVLVNWPMIDYVGGPVIGVSEDEAAAHLAAARRQSRAMMYWLQTEAPRPDGGTGWPGLRLRPDVAGTADGLAMAPYIRESRRLRARTRVVEQDLSLAVRGDAGAVSYPDSVGIGMYRIDLHPSTGGDNFIDVSSTPFQLPLGSLIPERTSNLLAGSKNLGTTHVTNGCYRLHPTEWNVGEVSGLLAAHCLDTATTPERVHADPDLLARFQLRCEIEGIERAWPEVRGY
jgi:hypothetical protein